MNIALHGDREFVSYLTLRRAVGVMGVLLPIVLSVGHIAFSGRFEIMIPLAAITPQPCGMFLWVLCSQ
jgi:hypothetical protein